MSDTTTVARPYAKAVFEHALETKQLSLWSEILHDLAAAVLDEKANQFLGNPAVTEEQQIELLMALFAKNSSADETVIRGLVSLLAHNKRLMLLPDIQALFEEHRAEQEKTLEVKVSSFSELSEAQQQLLISSLSKRLERQVTLDIAIDKTLLGGALIHAGDLVIDGSVRGKLDKLAAGLAA